MKVKYCFLGFFLASILFCNQALMGAKGVDALSFSAPFAYPELKWETDYETAKAKSDAENKPLFILFEGSDWCPSCKVLKSDILNTQTFIDLVSNHFIFLDVDFPVHQRLDAKKILQNQKLEKQFQVEGFPTVVIALPNGDSLVFAGNFTKGPEESAHLFLKESSQAVELEKVMSHFDSSNVSAVDLKELYHQAKQLRRNDYAAVLLDAGSRSGENTFFLREQYRKLAEKGEIDSVEAKKIKQKLLAEDPENLQGHHLFLAVLDFQALAKINVHKKNLGEIKSPLHSYLEGVGNRDNENKWRVQLMLAHFLYVMGEKDKAIDYAKAALERAPEHLRPEIELSIQKMTTKRD